MTKYTDVDYIAVNHFLMFDNKLDAYLFSRANITKSDNMQSLKNMSWQYFKQDRIIKLINTEKQRFIDNMPVLYDRLGMKNPITTNIVSNDKQTAEELEILGKIDKSEAIKRIETRLNSPSLDDKTFKDLTALLADLSQWKKEKVTTESNIVRYELPIRSKD